MPGHVAAMPLMAAAAAAGGGPPVHCPACTQQHWHERYVVRHAIGGQSRACLAGTACLPTRPSRSSSGGSSRSSSCAWLLAWVKLLRVRAQEGRMSAAHCSSSARCSTGSSGVASASRCLHAQAGQQARGGRLALAGEQWGCVVALHKCWAANCESLSATVGGNAAAGKTRRTWRFGRAGAAALLS